MGRYEYKIVDLLHEVENLGTDLLSQESWEEKSLAGSFEPYVQVLNEHDANGWELISVQTVNKTSPIDGLPVPQFFAYMRRQWPARSENGPEMTKEDRTIQLMQAFENACIGAQSDFSGVRRDNSTDEQIAEDVAFLTKYKPYVDRVVVEATRLSDRITETIQAMESEE